MNTTQTKKTTVPAGAKKPQDRKKAASAELKALRAEAEEGVTVVEYKGEFFHLYVDRFNQRMADDYEFMDAVSRGVIPFMVRELLGEKGHMQLIDLVRDEETGLVSTERMGEVFQELMEEAGLGN